jgi:hypothetical protein
VQPPRAWMTASTLRLSLQLDVGYPLVIASAIPDAMLLRPVYMDDNARPHRSRAVTAYLQSEAVTSVPWPTMRPVLNPIEHIWDMLGRRIHAREPCS